MNRVHWPADPPCECVLVKTHPYGIQHAFSIAQLTPAFPKNPLSSSTAGDREFENPCDRRWRTTPRSAGAETQPVQELSRCRNIAIGAVRLTACSNPTGFGIVKSNSFLRFRSAARICRRFRIEEKRSIAVRLSIRTEIPWNTPQLPGAEALVSQSRTWMMASTSTEMLPGSEPMPMALRAARPGLPKTSTIRSLNPFMTFG